MPKNTYGLDLGSYDIKIYDERRNTIWKEKNVIAFRDNQEIFAIGNEAYEMYERTPKGIEIEFPMENGVISKFNHMQFLMQNLLRKERHFSRGSSYLIAVPTDVPEVQKKAYFDLLIYSAAKAREVSIVERSIADAIGLNIDVKNTDGVMLINFGAHTTEISVLAGGGMVLNRLQKTGGTTFDQSTIQMVKNSQDFLIGMHTAEQLRLKFDVFYASNDSAFMVAGRDMITGLPMQKAISVNTVRAAMKEPLSDCINAIQSLLDRTPPEVRKAILRNGIFLTGGVSNMNGLDHYIGHTIGIKTMTAKNPDICAISGIKKMITTPELSGFAYSMVDENYRWMK